jgi:hypothetical protein
MAALNHGEPGLISVKDLDETISLSDCGTVLLIWSAEAQAERCDQEMGLRSVGRVVNIPPLLLTEQPPGCRNCFETVCPGRCTMLTSGRPVAFRLHLIYDRCQGFALPGAVTPVSSTHANRSQTGGRQPCWRTANDPEETPPYGCAIVRDICASGTFKPMRQADDVPGPAGTRPFLLRLYRGWRLFHLSFTRKYSSK